ncbi:cytochrome C biogenesis protein [Sphingomonas sp. AP4-R1]|uniref:protein-disulfide reductase DsbD family protein n=1 Tax=Sphingomonas sp. AP4-R1 TaxID=2735134 RepID=UPI00149382E5|nr:thioredoxin family protein [Sphingomonas sp. AP4-R1]QJU59981.1 cytochrome C biogenesis protein [Sphingomonas sp. AP4-R1]
MADRPGEDGREGLAGAALTGALAIIVATPCTAPFMAGALGYALVQPPLVAVAIFVTLALGFAAPFTAVALLPGLATRIPRPGAWMDVVKRVLAFPMLGAAAWLVWVLDQQAGSGALAVVLAAGIGLGFAGWIYGIAQRRHMMGDGARPLYLLSGVVAAGLVAAVGALIAPTAAEAPRTVAQAASEGPVAWSPERLAVLRKEGKPVFVNFTASWCITCQVNDKAALSTAEVHDALSRTGTTYMIADSTRYDPRIDDALAKYGRGGLPLYVVYPADGRPPVILPQLLTRASVVAALEAAAG